MDKNKKQQETKKQHKNTFYLCFSVLFQICQTCALYSEFDDSFPQKKRKKHKQKKEFLIFLGGCFFDASFFCFCNFIFSSFSIC